MIQVGCCGFRWGMARYFEDFRLVEIQQAFYQPPRVETARGWRARAPVDFVFTLKAWQLITHTPASPTYRRARLTIPPSTAGHYGGFRPTPEVWQAWEATRQVGEALQAPAIVFQCPPSFGETEENLQNLRQFFRRISPAGFKLVWEPRGGWLRDTVRQLCQELGLTHGVDPFGEETVYGQPSYYRLHGGPGYRHRFTSEELAWLRDRLAGSDAYVLFNNLSMYTDALAFQRLVAAG